MLAHYMLGFSLLCVGEFAPARTNLEQAISLYSRHLRHSPTLHSGHDPGIACFSYVALALWLLGYPDQALARSQEALVLARELSHPFSLAWALHFATGLYQFRREEQTVQALAETGIVLSQNAARRATLSARVWGYIL